MKGFPAANDWTIRARGRCVVSSNYFDYLYIFQICKCVSPLPWLLNWFSKWRLSAKLYFSIIQNFNFK